MKKFYIADLHYNHKNCLAFDNRPFTDVVGMNRALISNWNGVISNEDEVYVCGDMFWFGMEEAIEVLDKLNGQNILIKGNHDRCHDSRFREKFVKVTEYLEVKDGDNNIVLCHYPIPCFKNHYYGWYHFYGHVHNSFEWKMMEHDRYLMSELYTKPCFMYNVGAMMPYMNYTPRTFEEIVDGYWKEFGDK